MTEKQYKRANEIKVALSSLRLLKNSLDKRTVTIDFAFLRIIFESICESFLLMM